MAEQQNWRWDQRNGYEMLVVETEAGREIPCSIPLMGKPLVLVEIRPSSVTSSQLRDQLSVQVIFKPGQISELRDLLNSIEAHLYEMKILPEVADEEGHA